MATSPAMQFGVLPEVKVSKFVTARRCEARYETRMFQQGIEYFSNMISMCVIWYDIVDVGIYDHKSFIVVLVKLEDQQHKCRDIHNQIYSRTDMTCNSLHII